MLRGLATPPRGVESWPNPVSKRRGFLLDSLRYGGTETHTVGEQVTCPVSVRAGLARRCRKYAAGRVKTAVSPLFLICCPFRRICLFNDPQIGRHTRLFYFCEFWIYNRDNGWHTYRGKVGVSNRNNDGSEELAGCVIALIGLAVGALVALVAFIINQDRNKPRLPGIPEPDPSYKPPPAPSVTITLGGLGLVFFVIGILGLAEENGWVTFMLCGLPGLAMWGYLAAITQGTGQTMENTPAPRFVSTPRCYTISLPPNQRWNPEIAWRFVEQLTVTVPGVVLRIVAEPDGIVWQILDWRAGVPVETVMETVHAYYPDAQVEYVDDTLPEREYPFYRYTLLFRHAADFVWPIKFAGDLAGYDPLVALTHALTNLESGERVIYTLALSVPAQYAYAEGEKMVTTSRIHPLQFLSVWGTTLALMDATSGQARQDRYQAADQRVAGAKLGSQLFQCFLAVQIDSPHSERVQQLANVDTQVWQFERAPYNALVWIPGDWPGGIRRVPNAETDGRTSALETIRRCIRGVDPRWQQARLIMCAGEMAALWHLPYEDFTSPSIVWSPGRQVPASKEVARKANGLLLGHNPYAGRRTPIRLPYADRVTHVYVVGKTGVGKSTLLHHMIHQDIAAGKGVGVIDPHGRLVRDVLQRSIPPEREDDVVVVDMAQTDYPPPLNPFAIPEGVPSAVALSQVMGLLKRIYADEWSKTRMESAIYAALAVLLFAKQATPRDISRLFLDEVFRHQLLQHVTDPVALEYWYDEYGRSSEGVQKQTREPVLNRIRIFYRNAAVRNMVCHPHRLDFRQIVEQGKIFLASMSSEEVRSEQANLGALMMANFQMVAMSRQQADDPLPFYLYIDEVQQFVTTALPTVLSEARKYGLSLTVANQFLRQLAGETLEAVLGNVGSTVVFACGSRDARTLSHVLRPEFDAEDVANFDRFHAAVKMQVDGKTVPAFTLSTLPPVPLPDDAAEREARIRQKSIQTYTPWTREEVETWLADRYRRPDVTPGGSVTDYD